MYIWIIACMYNSLIPFDYIAKEQISDSRSAKRYSQDSSPYPVPMSPKLLRTEAHPSEGNWILIIFTYIKNKQPFSF